MKNKLTRKQKLFCDYYLNGSGNATEAVIKAGYNVKLKNGKPDRLIARNIASENLAKLGIQEYIRKKLDSIGFNDEFIKLQHYILISQDKNLSIKAKAIDMYYKKTGAYKVDKAEEGANKRLEEFLDRASSLFPD